VTLKDEERIEKGH
jgi:adenylate/nucleoside-diphosphate kinase